MEQHIYIYFLRTDVKSSPNVDEQFNGQNGTHNSGYCYRHQAKVTGGQGIHLIDMLKQFGDIQFAQVIFSIDIK